MIIFKNLMATLAGSGSIHEVVVVVILIIIGPIPIIITSQMTPDGKNGTGVRNVPGM